MALQYLPAEFRVKYDQLLNVIDSRTGKPVTDSLGSPSGNLNLKPMTATGGTHFDFKRGSLYQFDHTGRFPIVAIWAEIGRYYSMLGNYDGGFGRPLTDVVDLHDGGRCAIFEGGHIHEYGAKAEPYPASQCVALHKPEAPQTPFGTGPAGLPAAFHKKWVELSLIKLEDGKSIVEHLGIPVNRLSDNRNGGQRYNFLNGNLVSLDSNTPPVAIWGRMQYQWFTLGLTTGGLGHPLADPQDLPDGGHCQVFEGGHLHQFGNVVHTATPDKCVARYQPRPRFATWNSMAPHFQRKWSALCGVVHPHTRDTVVEMLGEGYNLKDNPNNIGGQYYAFFHGYLVSLSDEPPSTTHYRPTVSYGANTGSMSAPRYPPAALPSSTGVPFPTPFASTTQPGLHGMAPAPMMAAGLAKSTSPGSNVPALPTYNNIYFPNAPQHLPGFDLRPNMIPLELTEPFAVYGVIYNFWVAAGGFNSVYGRPLCDEQDLGDGGRCSIFEGGHIHLYNGVAHGVPADQCTAAFQPKPPPRHHAIQSAQPVAQPPMAATNPPPNTPQANHKDCCCGCNVVYRERGGDCRCGQCVWGTWSF